MSNSYNGTPPQWVIDTASATAITTDVVRLAKIEWVPGASALQGDECKVTDAAGNAIHFDMFATGAYQDVFDSTFPRWYNSQGLKVPTLTHGKVYITLQ